MIRADQSGLEFVNLYFKSYKDLKNKCTGFGKIIVLPLYIVGFFYVISIGLFMCLFSILINFLFLNKYKKTLNIIKTNLNELFFKRL